MKSLLLLTLVIGLGQASDLATVKSEPNLERRSERALDYAGEILTTLRLDIEAKAWNKIEPELTEFRAAADLCVVSLKATGKTARRNPKYFKKAEVRLRELGRRLRGLQQAIDINDRPKMEELIAYVDKLQDELVNLTMGVK